MSHTVTRVYNNQGYLSQLKSGSTVLQQFNDLDAFGNVTDEAYANGVVTNRSFDPETGALTAIDTTLGSTVLQNLDYTWRSNGILASRISTVGATQRKELFSYDAHNRLLNAETQVNSIAVRDLDYDYDLLGNLIDKVSGVTNDVQAADYAYGTNSSRLSEVTINGANYELTHDQNGAITYYNAPGSLPDTQITYNADNQPTSITVGSGPDVQESFLYDPDGHRIFRRSSWTDGGGSHDEDTYYVGNFEFTAFTNDPTFLLRARTRISQNVMRVMIYSVGLQTDADFEFAHRDHLGSIDKVTNLAGDVLRTMAFEPFGTRKSGNWQQNITASELVDLLTNDYTSNLSAREARGFTGHEHLDRAGFIHMNGRVYDPRIGRFLSPDPIVQAPTNSQSWNRYSYAFNSPLSFGDPTGFAAGSPPSGPVSEEELNRLRTMAQEIGAVLDSDNINVTFTNANDPDYTQRHEEFVRALESAWNKSGNVATAQLLWIFGGSGGAGSTQGNQILAGMSSAAGFFLPGYAAAGEGDYAVSQGRYLDAAAAYGRAMSEMAMAVLTAGLSTTYGTAARGAVAAENSFFQGTRYSQKVLEQMRRGPGEFHSFPESVTAFERAGTVRTITGGDGVVRQMLEVPGFYGGRDGVFQFLKEADGTINHRLFVPGP